jgi:hypothetical protein
MINEDTSRSAMRIRISHLFAFAVLIVLIPEMADAQGCVGLRCAHIQTTQPPGMAVPPPPPTGPMGLPPGLAGAVQPPGMTVPPPYYGQGNPQGVYYQGNPQSNYVTPPAMPYPPPSIVLQGQSQGAMFLCYSVIGTCNVPQPGPCGCFGPDGNTYPGQAQ